MALGDGKSTLVVVPVGAAVRLAGHITTGGIMSDTITTKEQVDDSDPRSVAVHVTAVVVAPENDELAGGLHVIFAIPVALVAVAWYDTLT